MYMYNTVLDMDRCKICNTYKFLFWGVTFYHTHNYVYVVKRTAVKHLLTLKFNFLEKSTSKQYVCTVMILK